MAENKRLTESKATLEKEVKSRDGDRGGDGRHFSCQIAALKQALKNSEAAPIHSSSPADSDSNSAVCDHRFCFLFSKILDVELQRLCGSRS